MTQRARGIIDGWPTTAEGLRQYLEKLAEMKIHYGLDPAEAVGRAEEAILADADRTRPLAKKFVQLKFQQVLWALRRARDQERLIWLMRCETGVHRRMMGQRVVLGVHVACDSSPETQTVSPPPDVLLAIKLRDCARRAIVETLANPPVADCMTRFQREKALREWAAYSLFVLDGMLQSKIAARLKVSEGSVSADLTACRNAMTSIIEAAVASEFTDDLLLTSISFSGLRTAAEDHLRKEHLIHD